MVQSRELRALLQSAAPTLVGGIDAIAADLLDDTVVALEQRQVPREPKIFNDPVWGTIELLPHEVLLLDSALLQRLRNIRQLGMAHYVYPGAGHNRLEHTRGVLEAAERILRALTHNAEERRRFGRAYDRDIPPPTRRDRVVTRLAALMHDTGHGPFSHATERIIAHNFASEFQAANAVLREEFDDVGKIAAGETVAVLFVLSDTFLGLLEHPGFDVGDARLTLGAAIVARILGSRLMLDATYLSGVISGPLDADKIDYMARDSHHAGLPLGLDITRLVTKLEVVTITPENAPNADLRARAEAAPSRAVYDIGISRAGLGAYEQMIIARVMLYDRIYYHHKVRAAEAMVRRLAALVIQERGAELSLSEWFSYVSDDAFVDILGGFLSAESIASGGHRSRTMAAALRGRNLYCRAFAFAQRYFAGLSGLPADEAKATRILLWSDLIGQLNTDSRLQELAAAIVIRAKEIAAHLPAYSSLAARLEPEHVIVDLPASQRVAGSGADQILTRASSGQVSTPNLFFNPDRWAEAYEHQKLCGYIFAARPFVALVSLASRIVFFERFRIAVTRDADEVAKLEVGGNIADVRLLGKGGVITAECAEMLACEKPRLAMVSSERLQDAIPNDLLRLDSGLPGRLASEFIGALPTGLPASICNTVVMLVGHLLHFALATERGGWFVAKKDLDERTLQNALRDHLRARDVRVAEGSEYAGGETDLVVHEQLVIENKVRGPTANPHDVGAAYDRQARRYSIAVAGSVRFVVLAYEPTDERAILPMPERISVKPDPSDETESVVVRLVVPYGQSVPSSA